MALFATFKKGRRLSSDQNMYIRDRRLQSLAGRSSIPHRWYFHLSSWCPHTAWTRTPTCPSQRDLCNTNISVTWMTTPTCPPQRDPCNTTTSVTWMRTPTCPSQRDLCNMTTKVMYVHGWEDQLVLLKYTSVIRPHILRTWMNDNTECLPSRSHITQ